MGRSGAGAWQRSGFGERCGIRQVEIGVVGEKKSPRLLIVLPVAVSVTWPEVSTVKVVAVIVPLLFWPMAPAETRSTVAPATGA